MQCRIVQYALQRHLPAGSTVSSQAGCLDSVLQSRHAEANAQIQSSRCAVSLPALMQRFYGVCSHHSARPQGAFALLAAPLSDSSQHIRHKTKRQSGRKQNVSMRVLTGVAYGALSTVDQLQGSIKPQAVCHVLAACIDHLQYNDKRQAVSA